MCRWNGPVQEVGYYIVVIQSEIYKIELEMYSRSPGYKYTVSANILGCTHLSGSQRL